MQKFWNLLRAWKKAPEDKKESYRDSYIDSIISYLYEKDTQFINDNYVHTRDRVSGWKLMGENADKNIKILQDIFRYITLKTFTEIRVQDINGKYKYEDVKKMLLEIVEGFK